MNDILTKILVIGSALAVFLIGKVCFHFKDDNPVEEMTEIVIKQETGFDIDLTPLSLESVDNSKHNSKV